MKQILLLFALLITAGSQAQEYLGIYPGYNGNGAYFFQNGPAYDLSSLSLSPNNSTSSAPATGDINVSIAFSDQQYTNLATNTTPATVDALALGVQNNFSAKKMNVMGTSQYFNTIGGPDQSYFNAVYNGNQEMSVSTHAAFNIMALAEGLAGQPTDASYYLGKATFTFSKPVDHPVMHVMGLGGFLSTDAGDALPFSTDYDLTSFVAEGSVSLSKNDGTTKFDVINNKVQSTFVYTDTGSGNTGSTGDWAGTGSVKVDGKGITSLTFDVYLRGKINGQQWTSYPTDNFNNEVFNGDRHAISWSIPLYDFCGKVFVDNNQNGTVGPDASPSTVPVAEQMPGGTYANSVSGWFAINACLVDNEGKVVAVVPVDPTTGEFCFKAPSDKYKVVLTDQSPTIGSSNPPTSLPPGWASTEESIGGDTTDANQDSQTEIYAVDPTTAPTVTTSTLKLGLANAPLESPSPVLYTRFEAENRGRYNELTWETSKETNNKGYVVERSRDGKVFVELGFVEGNGTTTETSTYTYADEKPSTDNYYRLRQVDIDGKSVLSEIRYVKVSGLKNDIRVFPNPFVDGLRIETGNYDLSIEVQILDRAGDTIVRETTQERYVDLRGLQTGAYLVTVKTIEGELLLQKKVVKIQ